MSVSRQVSSMNIVLSPTIMNQCPACRAKLKKSVRNFRMSNVLPGLYVGNYRDSKDQQQLDHFKISHILAIHDSPRRLLPDKHYLCIMAADTPDQNLSQYFATCNDFIHAARIRDGVVLIHCLAGMSRSVTVAVAYIMSVTNLSWKEALKVVRTGRAVANPNLGFQNQLQEFEMFKLAEERRRLRERFPSLNLGASDMDQCSTALSSYQTLLSNKDICEGNCSRGQNCPTGLCNSDTKPGVFRRRSSNLSSRSRLAPQHSTSCPTSPRQGLRKSNSRHLDSQPSTSSAAAATAVAASATSAAAAAAASDQSMAAAMATSAEEASTSGAVATAAAMSLHRSASTISTFRPRSSPAGLYSYTGSAPSSVHGSRVELASFDKGSAIYVGCAAPKSQSTWSVSKVAATATSSSAPSAAKKMPAVNRTPPISPKHVKKRTPTPKKR